ncbi:MAG: hypothetical protein P4N59_33565 [Negativicutes bacterium]|nr:hypothetical protein [Negativicutes bacterium]
MELIFFHVGDYKEKADKDGNVVKTLTRRAERLTEQAAQGIYRLRPKKTKLEVWSTLVPYLSQSAQIIAEELDAKAKFVNAIGQEDMKAVLKMMNEQTKEKCVVIVGENPHLSLWSEQLIGLKLMLDKYSAAGFVVNPPEWTATGFLWFASEPALLRIR